MDDDGLVPIDRLAERIYVALIGGDDGEGGITLEDALRIFPKLAYDYAEAFERERRRRKNPPRKAGFG